MRMYPRLVQSERPVAGIDPAAPTESATTRPELNAPAMGDATEPASIEVPIRTDDVPADPPVVTRVTRENR